MKSTTNCNREINRSLLSNLLYPIRWTPVTVNSEDEDEYQEPVRQYYHKISLEAMSLEDVFQYLENRCNHANVYFPSRSHRDFKGIAKDVQYMVQRDDLLPGKQLVTF